MKDPVMFITQSFGFHWAGPAFKKGQNDKASFVLMKVGHFWQQEQSETLCRWAATWSDNYYWENRDGKRKQPNTLRSKFNWLCAGVQRSCDSIRRHIFLLRTPYRPPLVSSTVRVLPSDSLHSLADFRRGVEVIMTMGFESREWFQKANSHEGNLVFSAWHFDWIDIPCLEHWHTKPKRWGWLAVMTFSVGVCV